MNNFDFLLAGKPKNYPHVEKVQGRVQITFDSDNYGMLLHFKGNNFWCGYVLVSQEEAQILELQRPALSISYCAPANRPISWMARTDDGRLTKPAQILKDSPGGDFWVGTHFDPSVEHGMAQAYLSQFCAKVNEAILNDSSVRGQAGDYAGV